MSLSLTNMPRVQAVLLLSHVPRLRCLDLSVRFAEQYIPVPVIKGEMRRQVPLSFMR